MNKKDIYLDDVSTFVVNKALEERRFCSVTDISNHFNIDVVKSRKLLNALVEIGRLAIVCDNPKFRVYAPREVIEQIVSIVKKPKWIESYPLPNKEKHLSQKRELERALYEFERFEELLYLKTKMLEEPVAFTLGWLGFAVKRLPDGSFADFEIMKDGFLAAVEVSGGNAGCPIAEVRQLTDYYNKTITEEKREIPHLLLLFNHFNDTDLKHRKEPFAPEIVKAARRYNITLATTFQLYEKVKRVKSGESKESIVREIIDGKWHTV